MFARGQDQNTLFGPCLPSELWVAGIGCEWEATCVKAAVTGSRLSPPPHHPSIFSSFPSHHLHTHHMLTEDQQCEYKTSRTCIYFVLFCLFKQSGHWVSDLTDSEHRIRPAPFISETVLSSFTVCTQVFFWVLNFVFTEDTVNSTGKPMNIVKQLGYIALNKW